MWRSLGLLRYVRGATGFERQFARTSWSYTKNIDNCSDRETSSVLSAFGNARWSDGEHNVRSFLPHVARRAKSDEMSYA